VFENRVLRRIFGPTRDDLTREWRKLHNEEQNDLYSSPDIIWMIILRTVRCAEHVARMGQGEVHTGFWWENLRKRDHLVDPGIDGRVIFRWIFWMENGGGGAWTD